MAYEPKKSMEKQSLDQLPAPFAVERLGRILMAIQDGPLRSTYLRQNLMHYSPQVMVRIIACAHRESAMGNHFAACLLEVAIDVLVRSGTYEALRLDFLSTCLVLCEHGVWAMFQRNDEDLSRSEHADRLLLNPPKGSLAEKGETLGRRKTLARLAQGDVLDRLIIDPHKDVIKNVLLNPRMDEEKVIRLCARRPVHPAVLEEVAVSRFRTRPAVRRSIVFNPCCPTPLACWLMTSMTRVDLMSVVNNGTLVMSIREAARQLLIQKQL
jgi:hypothetical protein